MEEEKRALIQEVEEMTVQHKDELYNQYMKIHSELGDELLNTKRIHREKINNLKVVLVIFLSSFSCQCVIWFSSNLQLMQQARSLS